MTKTTIAIRLRHDRQSFTYPFLADQNKTAMLTYQPNKANRERSAVAFDAKSIQLRGQPGDMVYVVVDQEAETLTQKAFSELTPDER